MAAALESGATELVLDEDVLCRYDVTGPRYTSYPTALEFHPGFGVADYERVAARTRAADGARPLSLYVHLPFCATVCYYCACNKVVTRNRARAAPYLERLYREIALQSALYPRDRPVRQLHWGGGTPTFLGDGELAALMEHVHRHFTLLADDAGEYSIEVDPRELREGTLATLRACGFNRLSIGVQDLDPRVQRAVNRIQSEAQTFGAIEAARALGFRSVNVDLIYGLPHQTPESFARTVERVLAVQPDRLSVFNYAHLPQRFKTQRQIDARAMPAAPVKLAILRRTAAELAAAGYCYIGMDHFARPDDELAVAQREGRLQRNFQGYSTHGGCDLVGLGVSAIGSVGGCYYQNAHRVEEYLAALDDGRLPIVRGIELTDDDRLRRHVIGELICQFRLDFRAIDRAWDIRFEERFAPELAALAPMEADGLLAVDEGGIEVLPRGRPLIRNICMMFDRYLSDPAKKQRFSRVI